jgi:hypothetical protein
MAPEGFKDKITMVAIDETGSEMVVRESQVSQVDGSLTAL